MSQQLLFDGQSRRFDKICPQHLDRLAVVYVRQSTMQQVVEHQESTRLQYGLVDRALALGWTRDRILVIDEDLGKSASSIEGRLGFQQLVAEVSLDHVGLILGLDISRLARSSKDWHQLLEICALFKTLISDLDGVYDPSHYNDRLLLGLKGTMSEAELHTLKQRLHQGTLNKAKRGELRCRLPTGYLYTPTGEIGFDPDKQVQQVIRLIFHQFERLGTIGAVLQYLVQHDIQLGMRCYSGQGKGQLEWRRPNRMTLQCLLKHPIYAGAYSYGRRQTDLRKQQPGRPATGRIVVPSQQWHVLIQEHVPAYISWEQFQRHQAQLQANQPHTDQPGALRSGNALLSGLLVCAICGNRLAVAYTNPHQYSYQCYARRANYAEPVCQHLAGHSIDAFITQQVLAALQPAALEVSLQAAAQLEHDRQQLHLLWQSRLERAAFEADRAQRHYQLVEPENRLVARQLAQNWEQSLLAQQQLQEEHQRFLHHQPHTLSALEQAAIRQLAHDIPALWDAPSTTPAQHKAIIRQLLDRITVQIEGNSERVHLSILWQGGSQTQQTMIRPVAKFTQLSYYPQLCNRIRLLRSQGLSTNAIAHQLNHDGLRPPKRTNTFNAQSVAELLRSLGLTQPAPPSLPTTPLQPHEWWLTDLAATLQMPPVTLYRWLRQGHLHARQLEPPSRKWIVWADQTELDRLYQFRHRSLSEEARQRWRNQHPRLQAEQPLDTPSKSAP